MYFLYSIFYFAEFIMNFKVMLKSMEGPAEMSSRSPGMKGLTLMLLVADLASTK